MELFVFAYLWMYCIEIKNCRTGKRRGFCRILTIIRLQCNEFVLGLFHGHWMLPKIIFGKSRQRSFKLINREYTAQISMSQIRTQEPVLPVVWCVVTLRGVLSWSFHFHFLLLTRNLSCFSIFSHYITYEVCKPLFGNHKFLVSRFPVII
jgi:hypothetical protein